MIAYFGGFVYKSMLTHHELAPNFLAIFHLKAYCMNDFKKRSATVFKRLRGSNSDKKFYG